VNGPISTIFGNAWPTESNQIIGAPDWFNLERHDLVGRVTGEPTEEQQRELWRAFFIERMKLEAHYETREQLGLKLEPISAPVQVVVIGHIERPIVD
jgi:uncharacterized protein (TIGR03435 family)